jgi:hypothetical protein
MVQWRAHKRALLERELIEVVAEEHNRQAPWSNICGKCFQQLDTIKCTARKVAKPGAPGGSYFEQALDQKLTDE